MSGPPTRRCALITGVSRGLGRALAVELARRGHAVIGCARSERALEELGTELGTELGGDHRLAVVDVTDEEAVQRWLAPLAGEWLPDVVLMNAGVANDAAPLWEIPAAELQRVVRVATDGIGNVVRALVPRLAARGSGVLVAMSSGLGRSAARGMAPYCAAKWAIEGMMAALALDLPHGLAAATLDPGMVRTDMLRQYLGRGAQSHPAPEAWAVEAATLLLSLDGTSNGAALSVGRNAQGGPRGFAARAIARMRGGK